MGSSPPDRRQSERRLGDRRRQGRWPLGEKHLRGRQWFAGGILVLLALILLVRSEGPFTAVPQELPDDPTFWQLLLADRLTLGLFRFAVIVFGLYVIMSIPALVIAGRWIKTFGSSMAADETQAAVSSSAQLEEKLQKTQGALEEVVAERDQLAGAVREALGLLEEGDAPPT